MAKSPAIQFYIKDWLSDPQLKMASFATKGIWIDMICYMWAAPNQGELSGTREDICKILGTTLDEFEAFISDVNRLGFCDLSVNVRECSPNVTPLLRFVNRRMVRDRKEKESARLRMQRARGFVDPLRDCSENVRDTPIGDGDGVLLSNQKTKYLECVFLTNEQHKKLIAKHGQQLTDKAIFILNNYIMGKKGGDPYVSHYHTLIGWPIERAKELGGKNDKREGGNRIPEWRPDPTPVISEEERQRNLKRLREITGNGKD